MARSKPLVSSIVALSCFCAAALPVHVAASGAFDHGDQLIATAEVDALAVELAAVGIAVYGGAGDVQPLVAAAQPVSPVALLEGQLPVLAAELGDGGGVTGAALDDLAPLPEGAPPLSYLLASWISTYDSPATVWAEELMGGGDAHDWRRPQQIVFPRVVLLLFVGDVSSAALSGEQPVGPSGVTDVAGRLPLGLRSPDVVAVCGLSNWINQVIGSMFDALKGDGTLPPILQFIVDGAVALAQGVVETVVGAIQLPLDVIVGAITLVGVVGMISTMIWPWTAELTVTDYADHFGHPGESEQAGELALTFGGTSDLWGAVGACAQAAGVELPSGTPAGATIAWLPAASPLLSSVQGDAAVGDDETATVRYVTAWEASPPTPDSILHTGLVVVRARVEMFSKDDIAKLVNTLISGLSFGTLLSQLFAPTVDSLGQHLADNMYVEAVEPLLISYHETPEPTTTTSAPTPTTVPSCPVGAWVSIRYDAEGQTIIGGVGIRLTVLPDLSGEIDFAGTEIISTPASAEAPVHVVVVMQQTGGFTFRLVAAGTAWRIADGVSQGYDMNAQATVDGMAIDANILVDELMSSSSTTFSGSDSIVSCPSDGTLVISWLNGAFSYTFTPA